MFDGVTTRPVADGAELHEECGVFGIWGCPSAPMRTYFGLFALQHRGQESAGIAFPGGKGLHCLKGMGLVGDVFDRADVGSWTATSAIGHVRYPTFGSSNYANAQPLVIEGKLGSIAVAHNGEIVNVPELRAQLERQGAVFATQSDSEVIAQLTAWSGETTMAAALSAALRAVRGGFALVALTRDAIFAARDPNGIRPLSIGKIGDCWVAASESCAFDAVGAEFVRDVEPGELVVFDASGLTSIRFAPAGRPALCSFEYIYFARPDSDIQGLNVHLVRKQLGRRLAKDYPVEADIVTGVPDSSISAAMGYAEESGIPYEIGLIKNRYVGRTFIQPTQEGRDLAVKLKLNPLRRVVEGKRVVLIDDSIVRGTTSRYIVKLLRDAGATEVHLRITSPPYRCPCYYGIDTSNSAELIAASHDVASICATVGADSLAYITMDGLTESLGYNSQSLCLACFAGDYVVPVPGQPKEMAPLTPETSIAHLPAQPAKGRS